MRLRLLVMSLVDRVLHRHTATVNATSTTKADEIRAAFLGTDQEIHEQTVRARKFADEVGNL